ncbi:hypothetical protein EYC58_04925 [Candidatus Saccharibacteria bacterium]|nr:MAG: hypothetical protein EYC58_04925 [Candidatus Saccharibacteria bacterium]
MAHTKRLVIVGGGFGGVKAAIELAGEKGLDITLISDKEHFLYYPNLYETATGGARRASIAHLDDVFKGYPRIKRITGEMVGLDTQRRHVVLHDGKQVDYDMVVVALGVVARYFGLQGLDTFSYNIKTYDGLLEFKQHLHGMVMENHEMDKNYIVVGAGPTGVELSAAMASYLERIKKNHGIASRRKIRISLVEAAPRVLPRMSEKASKKVHQQLTKLGVNVMTNKKVESADDDSIIISGKDIPSRTIVWTSGVSNHPFFKEHGDIFELAPNGRVVVNEHLEAKPGIFVIGDNAATKFTGLAQTALHDAVFVAKLIRAQLHGRPLPTYKPVMPPVVVPAGKHWAIFEWHGLRLTGRLAAMIRRAADVIGYHDVFPVGLTFGALMAAYDEQEECPTCAIKV